MKKVNHVKVAKFILSKKDLNNVKGGATTNSGCACNFTKNSGCIDGTGSSSSTL